MYKTWVDFKHLNKKKLQLFIQVNFNLPCNLTR